MDLEELTAIHHQVIDEKTAATRWCGERMDYGMAVEALLRQAKGGWRTFRGNVSPKTNPEREASRSRAVSCPP